MNPDLLTTIIDLAPLDRPTKSLPLRPGSSSVSASETTLTAKPSSTDSSKVETTEGRPTIAPTPFRPLSEFGSIPTTSDPLTPTPLTESEIATLHANAISTKSQAVPLAGEARHTYKRESSIHRFIAILHLQGVARRDIASRLGVAPSTVDNVLASQNARQFMGEKLETVFRDQTLERLTSLAEQAVSELEKILANPDVRAADKLKAIAMVLDRRFGQTTQVVKHVQGDLTKMSDADLLAVIGETSTESETIDV